MPAMPCNECSAKWQIICAISGGTITKAEEITIRWMALHVSIQSAQVNFDVHVEVQGLLACMESLIFGPYGLNFKPVSRAETKSMPKFTIGKTTLATNNQVSVQQYSNEHCRPQKLRLRSFEMAVHSVSRCFRRPGNNS
jgi:hypothetical protein